jgi:cytochrome c553
MKKLVTAVFMILILVALAATGCTNKDLVGPSPGSEQAVSTCVNCHTDKATLKELAVEPEEVKSEETTGEG